MPWLAKLAPDYTGFTALKLAVKNMREIFQKLVDERMKTFSPEKLEDFVDCYLKEIESTKDETSSFYKEVGSKYKHYTNVLFIILNLIDTSTAYVLKFQSTILSTF